MTTEPDNQQLIDDSTAEEAEATVETEVAPTIDPSDKVEAILNMRVPLIVKVAEKSIMLGNVLKFNLGGIIQFDKDVYEDIELMANNHTIALGQPVKIGENFGLRIVQVGSFDETIKKLGGV